MISKKEAARRLAIIAAEIRLALDAEDADCPSWADDLLTVADALDPSGFVDESVSRTDTRYSEAAPDDTRTGLSWTCPHGVTYSGSMDFCSGARNAHDELAHRDDRG